jgi:hypothetical protein
MFLINKPLRHFADTWIKGRWPERHAIDIALTGEAYMRVAQAEETFRLLLVHLGIRRFGLGFASLWCYLEWRLDVAIETERDKLERLQAAGGNADARAMRAGRERIRCFGMIQFIMRQLIVWPLYRAAGLPIPAASAEVLRQSGALLPTLRFMSEVAPYLGEALGALRRGTDIVLNTTAIAGQGGIQHLFSAEGDVDAELLTLALLKVMGPERYYTAATADAYLSGPG